MHEKLVGYILKDRIKRHQLVVYCTPAEGPGEVRELAGDALPRNGNDEIFQGPKKENKCEYYIYDHWATLPPRYTPAAQAVLERRRVAALAEVAVKEAAAWLGDTLDEAYEAWCEARDLDEALRPEVGQQETEESRQAFLALREAETKYAEALEALGRTLPPERGGEIAYRS